MSNPSLRVFRPAGQDDAQPQTTLFDFNGRSVREIVEWFKSQHPKWLEGAKGKERTRNLDLFLAFKIPGIGGVCGDWPIRQCKPLVLQMFVNSMPELKSAWTRRRWVTTICFPFNWAAEQRVIDSNPFKGVRMPRGAEGRDLTFDEFRKLLRESTPAFRRVLIFLRRTGMRPGEMKALTADQVNLRERVVVQSKHKTSEKTGVSRRVGLDAVAAKLLRWLMDRVQSGPLFRNSYGNPWRTRTLCKYMSELRDRIGLPASVKLYGCRHAFGTGAIINGLPTATVAELMGHRSITTTQRYVHLSGKNDHLAAAIEQATQQKTWRPSHTTPKLPPKDECG